MDRKSRFEWTVVLLTFFAMVAMFFIYLEEAKVHMQLTVWDVGANTQFVYIADHANLSQIPQIFFYKGLSFLMIPNINFLLFMQSIATALPVIPLYLISRDLRVLILYVLNPFIYGQIFFPVHFQTFFTSLFLFLYYFLKKNEILPSILFTILSSIVRYPYEILVLWFSLIEISSNRSKTAKVVLLSSIIITFFSLVFAQQYGTPQSNSHLGSSYELISMITGIVSVSLVFTSVGFLVRNRYALLLLPAVFLFLSSAYPPYHFPYVFQYQYSALFIAPLFIAFLNDRGKEKYIKGLLPLVATMFVLFSAFSPFSLTVMTTGYYPFNYFTHLDEQQYYNFQQILPYINGSTLLENDLAEYYPHSGPFSNTIMVMGITDNFTVMNFKENCFILDYGKPVKLPVDYVVVDLSSLEMELALYMSNTFYKHGYGIYMVDGELVVLKWNYSGEPVMFNPDTLVIEPHNSILLGFAPGIYDFNSTVTIGGHTYEGNTTFHRFIYEPVETTNNTVEIEYLKPL